MRLKRRPAEEGLKGQTLLYDLCGIDISEEIDRCDNGVERTRKAQCLALSLSLS